VVPGIRLCRGDRRHALPATLAEPITDPHTARWPGGCALIHGRAQRAGFRVMGLEKVHDSDVYRRTMEQLWKRKLRTYRPFGINTQEWGSVRKWREHYDDVVKIWRHIRLNCIVTCVMNITAEKGRYNAHMIAVALSAFRPSSAAFIFSKWQYIGNDVDDVDVVSARAPIDVAYWRACSFTPWCLCRRVGMSLICPSRAVPSSSGKWRYHLASQAPWPRNPLRHDR